MGDLYPNVRKALERGRPWEAIKITKDILKDPRSIPMTIAITGESGSGKSSLVNALRGLDQGDLRAAKTGVKETTKEPTEYTHREYPQVRVWDLPGIGTTSFSAAQYLHKVNFQKYDFFIIVSCGRFREHDAELGLEIQRKKKKFYFVRSKVDQDVSNEGRKLKSRFNQDKTLREIRDDCVSGLKSQGLASPKVFLVSSWEPNKFDFFKLEQTMRDEMSGHQRDSLLRAVLSYREEIIEEKKEELAGTIKGRVTRAVFAGLVPGLSLFINEKIVANFAKDCQVKLDLTEQNLKKMSQESNVSVSTLKNAMRLSLHPDPEEINLLIALGVLSVIGIPSQMIFSGMSIAEQLPKILDVIACDAQEVLKVALKSL